MTIGLYLTYLFVTFGAAYILGYITGTVIRLTDQSLF